MTSNHQGGPYGPIITYRLLHDKQFLTYQTLEKRSVVYIHCLRMHYISLGKRELSGYIV